jgi:hypothetical protein
VTLLNGERLRQELYFDETKGQAGLFAVVARRIREIVWPKLMLARFYAGRVTSQASDGSVALVMDDPEIAGQWKGLHHVPLALGMPGVRIVAEPGSRVRVFFDAGNPSRPRAALWEQDTPVTELILTADTLTVNGNLVVTGNITASGEVTASGEAGMPIPLTGHTHPTAAPGAASLPILFVPPGP